MWTLSPPQGMMVPTAGQEERRKTMDLATAIRLVVEDVRQSYPQMSEPAAIEHARDSVGVAELNWDEPNAAAWQLVLEAHVGELVLSVAGLVDATLRSEEHTSELQSPVQ